MGKLFIFEHQGSADKIQDEMTDNMQKLLNRYGCSGRLGFEHQADLLRADKLVISLCTSSDLKNAIIIGIMRDIHMKHVVCDGPLAEHSYLIFDSDSVYLIQILITLAWGSRISYGCGKAVFAQSLRSVLDKAGINTWQYIFCRDAYLDKANGYQELMKILHT